MGAAAYQHIIARQHTLPQRASGNSGGRGCSARRWITLTVSEGALVYSYTAHPCSGIGLSWSSAEFDATLTGDVAAVLFDDMGRGIIEDMLLGLADTDFAKEGIERVFADTDDVEDWRVGEAIAETYLTQYRFCYFPWPDGRDVRKRGSSLPGADLVGFGIDGDGDCFAFGEVKTSSELSYPPSIMYGRTGLKKQMEDLRDCETIRDDLLKYLGFRMYQSSWRARFIAATQRYLQDSSDIHLFGVLIRDVQPNDRDLSARVDSLAQGCPAATRIELLALYLPEHSLNGIGTAAVAKRKVPDA